MYCLSKYQTERHCNCRSSICLPSLLFILFLFPLPLCLQGAPKQPPHFINRFKTSTQKPLLTAPSLITTMAGNQIPPPPPVHMHPGQPNQQAMGGHPRTPQQQHPLPQNPLAQQQQQRPQQPPQAQLTPDQQRHLDAQQHQQKLQREQAQQQQLQARERQQQQTLALQRQQQQEYQRQQSLIQHAQTVQTLSLRDEQPTPDQARERLSTYAVFRFEQAGSFPGSRVSGGAEHYCSSDDSSDDDDGWHTRKKKIKKRTVHSTITKKKKAPSPWIDARRIPIPDFKREDVVREIRRLDRETKSLIEKKARLSNEKQRHLELTLDELRRVNAALDVEGNYETNLVQLDDQIPVVVKKHVVEHHDHHHHRRKESRERSRRHGRDGESVKIVSLFGVYQKRPLPSRRREERGRERKSSSHVHEMKVKKEMEPTSITAFFKTSPRPDVDVMALYYQVEAQKDARRLEAQQQQYWLEQQQQQFQQQQLQQQQQFQQQQQLQQHKQQQPQQQQQKPQQQQQQQPKQQQQNRQDDLQHHGVQILNPQNQQKDKKPDQKDQKPQKGEQPRQGQQYHKQQPSRKDDHHTRHRSPSHHRSPSRHHSPHRRHRSPHRRRRSSSRSSSSSSSRHSQTFSARDSVSSTLSFPSRDSKDGDRRRAYNQHRRYSEGHFGIVEPNRAFPRREALPYPHHGPEVRRIAPVVNVEQIEANAYHAGRADERLETREMIATVAAAAAAGPKAVVSRHRRVGSAPVPQIVYAQAPPPPLGARRLRMVGELEEEDSEDEEEGWSGDGADDSSEDYGVVMPGERRVYPVPRAPPPLRRSGAVVMEERMGGRVRMVRGADVQQAMRAERVQKGENEVVYVRVGQDERPGLVRPLKGGQRSFERRSPVVENHGGFPFGERNPFAPRPGLAERR